MAELLQIEKPKTTRIEDRRWQARAAAAFSRVGTLLLQSRWWPGVIQVPTLLVFLVIFYAAFFGPADPRRNFATVMSWIVWWPLLAVTYLIFGRIWCAACPMITIGDCLQKHVSLRRKAPNFLKKRYLGAVVLLMVLASLGLFFLAALIHSRISGEPIRQNLSLFGLAFLPLVLMSHISHNLGMMTHQTHLILPAVAGLFGYQIEPDHLGTLLSPPAWHGLHAAIILVGTGMTLWLVRRICHIKQEGGCPRYASLPYLGLAVVYTITVFLILHPDMLLRV